MDKKTRWKIYYQKNKERLKKRAKDYYRTNLEKYKMAHIKWYKIHGAEWRKKNIEKVRASGRKYANKYYKEHPELMKARTRSRANKVIQTRYRLKHRKECIKRCVDWARRKRDTDTNYRLNWLLRSRILSAIKKQLGDKAYKTIELLGCSIQVVREHIERQFRDGMTWKNHGKVWEIDHIQPVSSFDLTMPKEQKKAFNYKNLQPLIKKENRLKGSKTG